MRLQNTFGALQVDVPSSVRSTGTRSYFKYIKMCVSFDLSKEQETLSGLNSERNHPATSSIHQTCLL